MVERALISMLDKKAESMKFARRLANVSKCHLQPRMEQRRIRPVSEGTVGGD